jgi:hydroxymethylglutaryl-CoA lyase
MKGLDLAIMAGVKEVAVFAAASETFSKKNTNCTISESIDRFFFYVMQLKKQVLLFEAMSHAF